MPTLFEILGYRIFFWSNENNEPVYVHICKGSPTNDATKIWLPPDSNPVLVHNNSRIPQKDLNRILKQIASSRSDIIAKWYDYFGK